MQVSWASSPTCPSQLAPIGHTSNICTKLNNAQVGCVTNVDSNSLYACTYVAGVRDISKIVCYHQVLFAAVTKQFEEKTTNIFAASGFHKIANIHVLSYAFAHTLLEIYPYTVCSQFKHYVGLVNFLHSSTCPMFLYNLYFWHVTVLHTILNGYALLTTLGVQINYLWRVECLKKSADFDVSGPDFH